MDLVSKHYKRMEILLVVCRTARVAKFQNSGTHDKQSYLSVTFSYRFSCFLFRILLLRMESFDLTKWMNWSVTTNVAYAIFIYDIRLEICERVISCIIFALALANIRNRLNIAFFQHNFFNKTEAVASWWPIILYKIDLQSGASTTTH